MTTEQPQNNADGQPVEGGTQENQEVTILKQRLEALERERGEFSTMISQLQRTNEHLEQMVAGRQEPEFDPDAYPETYADVQRLTEKQIQRAMEQQLRPLVNNMQRQTYETQLALARKDNADFDQVVQYASELLDRNPQYKAVLENSDNLPATMYSIGQLHPKYREKLIADARQDTIKNIANPQATIAGRAGSPENQDEIEKLRTMPREEFLRKHSVRR